MSIDSKNFVLNLVVGRALNATSLAPALIGSMMRNPMPGLLFTVLLAKREAQVAVDTTPSKGSATVPNFHRLTWDEARSQAEKLGWNLVLQPQGGSLKGLVVWQEPQEGKPAPANGIIKVELKEQTNPK